MVRLSLETENPSNKPLQQLGLRPAAERRRSTDTAMRMWARFIGAALLAVGLFFLGFRLVEYLLGGFVGQMYVGGVTITVIALPLVAVGVTAVGLGWLLLWMSGRAVRS